MLTRLRTGWLAGGGALLLTLSIAGVALGAPGPDDGSTGDPVVTEETEPVVDTTATFEDLDGDGVDDDCEDGEVVPDETAAAAALAAADLDGDGVISVWEAAQTDWLGGTNCNHGGYVSGVAQGETDADEADETDETEEAEETAETACEAVPAPELPTEFTTVGAWVSLVARSDATGGKNCNHGGAVSAAVKAAQAARDLLREASAAERDAEKADRAAERDAAKAARAAEREAAKAARQGGQGKGLGKGKGHGKGR